jgi:solute carrier family 24 (sodium/potassium/calcium exchanger), member 6
LNYYQEISHTLAGVTFLAFANGAPDVLTAVLAGSSSSDSTVLIPFGSIFGASLFSTAFILSAVIFLSPG